MQKMALPTKTKQVTRHQMKTTVAKSTKKYSAGGSGPPGSEPDNPIDPDIGPEDDLVYVPKPKAAKYSMSIGLLGFLLYLLPDNTLTEIGQSYKIAGIKIGELGDIRATISIIVLLLFMLLLQTLVTNVMKARRHNASIEYSIDPFSLHPTDLKEDEVASEAELNLYENAPPIRLLKTALAAIGLLLGISTKIIFTLALLYFSVWKSFDVLVKEVDFESLFQLPPAVIPLFFACIVSLIVSRTALLLVLVIPITSDSRKRHIAIRRQQKREDERNQERQNQEEEIRVLMRAAEDKSTTLSVVYMKRFNEICSEFEDAYTLLDERFKISEIDLSGFRERSRFVLLLSAFVADHSSSGDTPYLYGKQTKDIAYRYRNWDDELTRLCKRFLDSRGVYSGENYEKAELFSKQLSELNFEEYKLRKPYWEEFEALCEKLEVTVKISGEVVWRDEDANND